MDGLRAEEGDGLEQKPGVLLTAKPDKALSLSQTLPQDGRALPGRRLPLRPSGHAEPSAQKETFNQIKCLF